MLENIKKYINYLVLTAIIFILFLYSSYDKLNKFSTTRFVIDGEEESLKDPIEYFESYGYISYDDVETIKPNDLYKEKALNKIIITANNKVKAYTLDSGASYTNFVEDADQNKTLKYTKINEKDYILLDELCSIYNYTKIENSRLNSITLVKDEMQEAKIKYARVYGYVLADSKFKRVVVDSKCSIFIVKDSNYYTEDIDVVTAIVNIDGKDEVLYVFKNDMDIKFSYDQNAEQNNEFNIYIQNEDNLTIDTSDTSYNTFFSGLKLISKNGDLDKTYDSKVITGGVNNKYMLLTNGYRASNYDSDLTAYALQNIDSRENMIKIIAKEVSETKAKGVVVNFRNFKVSSKEYFTQFIKELSMYMHSLNKEVLVYIPLDATYIDNIALTNYADKSIFVQYGLKSTNSKTSGPDSSVTWIEKNINKLAENKINLNKVIIEIPLYSILWTEKEQKVVDVQYVYNSALDDYMSKNGLTPIQDEQSGQLYIEHTKGSLTYKMWLENEYSFLNKIAIAKKNNLAGVILYKKGYEKTGLFSQGGLK